MKQISYWKQQEAIASSRETLSDPLTLGLATATISVNFIWIKGSPFLTINFYEIEINSSKAITMAAFKRMSKDLKNRLIFNN